MELRQGPVGLHLRHHARPSARPGGPRGGRRVCRQLLARRLCRRCRRAHPRQGCGRCRRAGGRSCHRRGRLRLRQVRPGRPRHPRRGLPSPSALRGGVGLPGLDDRQPLRPVLHRPRTGRQCAAGRPGARGGEPHRLPAPAQGRAAPQDAGLQHRAVRDPWAGEGLRHADQRGAGHRGRGHARPGAPPHPAGPGPGRSSRAAARGAPARGGLRHAVRGLGHPGGGAPGHGARRADRRRSAGRRHRGPHRLGAATGRRARGAGRRGTARPAARWSPGVRRRRPRAHRRRLGRRPAGRARTRHHGDPEGGGARRARRTRRRWARPRRPAGPGAGQGRPRAGLRGLARDPRVGGARVCRRHPAGRAAAGEGRRLCGLGGTAAHLRPCHPQQRAERPRGARPAGRRDGGPAGRPQPHRAPARDDRAGHLAGLAPPARRAAGGPAVAGRGGGPAGDLAPPPGRRFAAGRGALPGRHGPAGGRPTVRGHGCRGGGGRRRQGRRVPGCGQHHAARGRHRDARPRGLGAHQLRRIGGAPDAGRGRRCRGALRPAGSSPGRGATGGLA